MNLQKSRSFIQLGVILISVLAGSLIIAPIFKIETKLGTLIGGILGIFLINVFTIPKEKQELAKGISGKYSDQSNIKHFERILEIQEKGFYRSLFHPTQLPATLGGLWFFVSIAILLAFVSLFPTLIPMENRPIVLLYFVFTPSFSAFGFSGYQMIRRKETVNKHGQINRGFLAYLYGVFWILFGWGFLLFLFSTYIFS